MSWTENAIKANTPRAATRRRAAPVRMVEWIALILMLLSRSALANGAGASVDVAAPGLESPHPARSLQWKLRASPPLQAGAQRPSTSFPPREPTERYYSRSSEIHRNAAIPSTLSRLSKRAESHER